MTGLQLRLNPDATTDADNGRIDLPCVHCGLATVSKSDSDPTTIFCCNGCRGAYELIHGWGLEDYYALRDQRRHQRGAKRGGEKSRYDAFDSDAFLGASRPKQQADGLVSAELAVHGLHCAACAWLIENAAARTPGWHVARVKMSDHTIRTVFDPAKIPLSEIARLLDRLGYELSPLIQGSSAHSRLENRRLMMQIAIAGFCAANAMWIAIALYAGEASGVEASHRHFLRMIGTALGVIAVALPGRTFFKGALASLRTRTPHMDLPVALGLSVGTIAGLANAISGRGDVYFDSLAVLVFLLLIGRWIQFHQQHRAARAVDLLLRITPAHARRLTLQGDPEWVLVDALQCGEIVRVSAGECVPVDGRIVAGESMLDRSLLTGESRPIRTFVGEEVSAGMVNLVRNLDIEVAATGRDSRIGKVMQAVESAVAEKTPVVQLADRIGGVFVMVVMTLALIVLVSWSRYGFAAAAANATALLIVACPCALALATPLAIAVCIGRAANNKILIREGGSLQQLAKSGILWFDKTGTLTEGRPRANLVFGSFDAVRHAAAIEKDCCHPIAEAIVRLVEGSDSAGSAPPLIPAFPTVTHLGGVSGEINGHMVEVGHLAFIQSRNNVVGNPILEAVNSCLDTGTSPVVVAIDGKAVSVLAVADPLKPQAQQVVAELKKGGWQVGILSGDHPTIVQQIAKQIGIQPMLARGGLSPEEKLSIVTQRDGQNVVMIGDGANDAAALAAADVGIAVRGGADVSLQAAPIFIASGMLSGVTDLITGARRASMLIYTAFAVSLGYNVVAVGLAMAGQISPLLAAILMPISSVTVLTLTLAWPTFRRVKA